LDLGDARLNRRAVLLAERLAHKPGASIPNACQNWSETVAAYRFLSNEDVGWDDVMQAHWQASEQRIGQHPPRVTTDAFQQHGRSPTRSSWSDWMVRHKP
jgi:hypothetical protein